MGSARTGQREIRVASDRWQRQPKARTTRIVPAQERRHEKTRATWQDTNNNSKRWGLKSHLNNTWHAAPTSLPRSYPAALPLSSCQFLPPSPSSSPVPSPPAHPAQNALSRQRGPRPQLGWCSASFVRCARARGHLHGLIAREAAFGLSSARPVK